MSRKVYNGRDLFIAYCKWGKAAGNERLKEYAFRTSGRKSQMGPTYAMWRWAFENPEEAWPYYRDYFFEVSPELPQPTKQDFYKLLLEKAEKNESNAPGGKRGLQRFAALHGLETNYGFEPGDVAQVVRRSSPIYQSLVIVESVDGDNIEAFMRDSSGRMTTHQFSAHELAAVGKAPLKDREGAIVVSMTKVPKLKEAARENGLTLVGIHFPEYGSSWTGVRFSYSYVEDGQMKETSISYDDFETGVDAEIERLQNVEVPV